MFMAKLCPFARIIPAVALPCSKNGRVWIAQGDKRPVSELRFGFSVPHWASRAIANDPSCRAQHCVPRRGVPFHGLAETRIDVGLALGNHTEFECGTRLPPLLDRELREKSLGRRIGVGAAHEGYQSMLWRLPRMNGPAHFRRRQRRARRDLAGTGGGAADPELSERRSVNHAGTRRRIDDQSYIDGELAIMAQEFARPIERIDQDERLSRNHL